MTEQPIRMMVPATRRFWCNIEVTDRGKTVRRLSAEIIAWAVLDEATFVPIIVFEGEPCSASDLCFSRSRGAVQWDYRVSDRSD